eukprot:123672-Prymnesium_polylepis.1
MPAGAPGRAHKRAGARSRQGGQRGCLRLPFRAIPESPVDTRWTLDWEICVSRKGFGFDPAI